MIESTPNASPPRDVGLIGLIWLSWRELFRSRDAILHQSYKALALGQGKEVDESTSLDELREWYREVAHSEDSSRLSSISKSESKTVCGSRMSSAWLVLWTTVVPLLVAGLWVTRLLSLYREPSLVTVIGTLVQGIFVCFAAFLGGMFLQGLLLQAILPRVNRALAAPASAVDSTDPTNASIAVDHGASGNSPPWHAKVVPLARLGFVGAVTVLFCILIFADTSVSIETQGDTSVYTSQSTIDNAFYVLPVATALLTVMYASQRGMFRVFGLALGGITAWLVYNAATMDLSNHHVTVTPTSVLREVGTKSEPIRHQIDFTTTSYLAIVEVPGEVATNYALVAISHRDETETRVPIFNMMEAALPQIIENARKNGVFVEDFADGSPIPAALRHDAGG